MMSQNRQDEKDRLRSELDFDVNRRSESEVQALSHRMTLMMDKIEGVEHVVRQALNAQAKAQSNDVAC
jgi:CRP/FNR family cyclic AMP-dependent transcriptional regulator